MGIGTQYEEATDATASDSSTALGPRHPSRGYTSSQPLPDLEDIPVFAIQHDIRTSPFNGEAPALFHPPSHSAPPYHPGKTIAKHYHHQRLMLNSIVDLIETRRLSGLRTNLHKIRAHFNIQGNDLADAASKLAVTHYDTLPPPQTRQVKTGETVPRPNYWVMYSAKSSPPLPALSTGTNCATLRRPWWTIPEAERLQMHALA